MAYFLALQVGQVAQVVLPSSQHFMPQADLVSVLGQHLLQDAQPVKARAVQARVAQRTRSFTVFIVVWFVAVV